MSTANQTKVAGMSENQTSLATEVALLMQFAKDYPDWVVLTGAGLSLASGIPTYRDVNGIWQGGPPMQHQDFIHDEAVRKRYWARSFLGRATVTGAQPNPAHNALAALEQRGLVRLVISQNVDNLHQRAGSQQVVDLHGNLMSVICLNCGAISQREALQQRLFEANPTLAVLHAESRPDGDAVFEGEVSELTIPACLACSGTLMPDVVFYGGTVPKVRVEYCLEALEQAAGLVVIGSSLQVYSGYRFCLRAQEWGKPIALLNPGVTRADALAALHLRSPCSGLLTGLLESG